MELEVEFTIKGDEQKCEQCSFYLFINSGYGYCRKYPPKEELIREHWWSHKQSRISYQVVEWCRKACGEFK